jgi:hypothetical protein
MPTRGDEPTSTSGTGAVSQREVAALVYNYLRSNGFVKVRPLESTTTRVSQIRAFENESLFFARDPNAPDIATTPREPPFPTVESRHRRDAVSDLQTSPVPPLASRARIS